MNIPDPKTVIALANKLAEAEAAVERLRGEWRAIFSGETSPMSSKPIRASRDNSFAAKVEQVFMGNPDSTFTIAEITASLGETDQLKVGRTLFRLSTRKRIESRGRGLYGAKRQLEIAA